jgi:hypothetical protein
METLCPHFVTIRDSAAIGIRAIIFEHNREQQGMLEDAAPGSGVILLPNVAIGRGTIVTVLGGSRYVAEDLKGPTN